jgi:uncharacterized LabA/DUF88 family protein
MLIASNRIMLFIDGGYLRRKLMDLKNDELFDLQKFQDEICKKLIFDRSVYNYELIRTYYYDCNFDITDPELSEDRKRKFAENKTRFDGLNGIRKVEVKIGHLSNSDPPRQKGMDVLIAIDMLSKGFKDHYDIGILFCGDKDFIPIVKAIKDQTGKRVFGGFFINYCPPELMREFDEYYEIPFPHAWFHQLGL